MKIRPAFSGFEWTVDILPIDQVVDKIHAALVNEDDTTTLKIVEHIGQIRVDMRSFAEETQTNQALRALPTMRILEWVGEA